MNGRICPACQEFIPATWEEDVRYHHEDHCPGDGALGDDLEVICLCGAPVDLDGKCSVDGCVASPGPAR